MTDDELEPGTTEWWRAVKAAQAERSIERLGEAGDFWTRHAIQWVKHTQHHWTTTCAGTQLQYWPSKGKWMWRNKIYLGTPKNLFSFIRNRIKEQNDPIRR